MSCLATTTYGVLQHNCHMPTVMCVWLDVGQSNRTAQCCQAAHPYVLEQACPCAAAACLHVAQSSTPSSCECSAVEAMSVRSAAWWDQAQSLFASQPVPSCSPAPAVGLTQLQCTQSAQPQISAKVHLHGAHPCCLTASSQLQSLSSSSVSSRRAILAWVAACSFSSSRWLASCASHRPQ